MNDIDEETIVSLYDLVANEEVVKTRGQYL